MSSGRPSESPLALPQDTGASSGPVFHPRCGQLVTLSQGNRTASRSHATQVIAIVTIITLHYCWYAI